MLTLSLFRHSPGNSVAGPNVTATSIHRPHFGRALASSCQQPMSILSSADAERWLKLDVPQLRVLSSLGPTNV